MSGQGQHKRKKRKERANKKKSRAQAKLRDNGYNGGGGGGGGVPELGLYDRQMPQWAVESAQRQVKKTEVQLQELAAEMGAAEREIKLLETHLAAGGMGDGPVKNKM